LPEKKGKILIIDDDEDVLLAASLLLKKHVNSVYTEKNPQEIPNLLNKQDFDVILLDMNFTRDVTSGSEGFYWLDKILEIDPAAIVILVTAYGDIEMAVRAVKEGATDFILKPWQNEKLVATLSASLQLRKSKLEASQFRSQQKQLSRDIDRKYHEIIGVSPAMQVIFRTIDKVAATQANVLILGENGTGKEMVARAIHRNSDRADNVFISVDMGAISETLFESELFGHTKGAFTDAREDRAGRFEIATGGTLFLDEIVNLPISLQAKLLTVLQQREIIRLGSNKSRAIDIRLICATNMDIDQMVRENKFRQDLLYRINTVEIKLPPLRQRIEDLPLLANHFLNTYAKKYKKPLISISAITLKKLASYHWPGNIRELDHAIERAVIMSDAQELQPEDFLLTLTETDESGVSFQDYRLATVEKMVIQKALNRFDGNVSRAAKELGLTRASLYRRMEKYGI
jgi:two-component system response regulator HydG